MDEKEAVTSSIVLVKPSGAKGRSTYKLLILKRKKEMLFGDCWSFPGGHVESQDSRERWKDRFPAFYKEHGGHRKDFSERVCAIRECFEECNLLLQKHSHNQPSYTSEKELARMYLSTEN